MRCRGAYLTCIAVRQAIASEATSLNCCPESEKAAIRIPLPFSYSVYTFFACMKTLLSTFRRASLVSLRCASAPPKSCLSHCVDFSTLHATRLAHKTGLSRGAVLDHTFIIMNGHTQPPTQSVEELSSSLKALGIDHIPSVPDTSSYPTFNQIDIYRSHITQLSLIHI